MTFKMATKRIWYNLSANEAIEQLGSNHHGLSQEEAQKRLEQFGPNELYGEEKTSPWLQVVL